VCEQCAGLAERFDLRGPEDYRNTAAEVAAMVNRGSLQVVKDHGVTLTEVATSEKWPGDVIVHDLVCTQCGAKFQLFADTYHGRASWSGEMT